MPSSRILKRITLLTKILTLYVSSFLIQIQGASCDENLISLLTESNKRVVSFVEQHLNVSYLDKLEGNGYLNKNSAYKNILKITSFYFDEISHLPSLEAEFALEKLIKRLEKPSVLPRQNIYELKNIIQYFRELSPDLKTTEVLYTFLRSPGGFIKT